MMYWVIFLKFDAVKRVTSIITILCLSLVLMFSTGCWWSEEEYTIYFGVDKAPVNLDPQLANTYAEYLYVRNCFKGLYKLDSNDNPVLDLASSHTVSNDGLTHTFKIATSNWSNGERITANDFKFAILRAADHNLKAPHSDLIKNIKGVSERLEGKTDDIGVAAPNTSTLVITLLKPDENFNYKLCKPIFMPCQEKFFNNCGGKYGLSVEHIITNGNYTVSRWPDKRNLELKISESFKTELNIAEKVIITESQSGKLNSQRIKDKEIGMTAVNGEDYSNIDKKIYSISVQYRKNYAIRFNKTSNIGKNTQLTKALATSIDRDSVKRNINSRFMTTISYLPSDSLVLQSRSLNGVPVVNSTFNYSAEESRKLFLEAVKEYKNSKLPTIEILCPDNDEIKSILTNAISGWQSSLGAVVNIKTLDNDSDVTNAVINGNYSVAFVALNDNAENILSSFYGESAPQGYNDCVDKLLVTDSFNDAKSHVKSATEMLSTDSSIIPVVSVPTAYISAVEYKNVHFSKIDGTIDFSIVYK